MFLTLLIDLNFVHFNFTKVLFKNKNIKKLYNTFIIDLKDTPIHLFFNFLSGNHLKNFLKDYLTLFLF